MLFLILSLSRISWISLRNLQAFSWLFIRNQFSYPLFYQTRQNPENAANLVQAHLDRIMEWAKKWKISINLIKSVYVNFTLRKRLPNTRIVIDNTILPMATHTKYLGMHIDDKLRWDIHIKEKSRIERRKCTGYWTLTRVHSTTLW